MDLQYVLLGNDFLSSNDVHIKYSQHNRTVLINNEHVNLLTETGTSSFVNFTALKANVQRGTHVAPLESHGSQGWDGLK